MQERLGHIKLTTATARHDKPMLKEGKREIVSASCGDFCAVSYGKDS
jgi:hypothetical protein